MKRKSLNTWLFFFFWLFCPVSSRLIFFVQVSSSFFFVFRCLFLWLLIPVIFFFIIIDVLDFKCLFHCRSMLDKWKLLGTVKPYSVNVLSVTMFCSFCTHSSPKVLKMRMESTSVETADFPTKHFQLHTLRKQGQDGKSIPFIWCWRFLEGFASSAVEHPDLATVRVRDLTVCTDGPQVFCGSEEDSWWGSSGDIVGIWGWSTQGHPISAYIISAISLYLSRTRSRSGVGLLQGFLIAPLVLTFSSRHETGGLSTLSRVLTPREGLPVSLGLLHERIGAAEAKLSIYRSTFDPASVQHHWI